MSTVKSPIYAARRAVVVILASGLFSAALLRLAPGFGLDERALDARFTAATQESISREHDIERNPVSYYFQYWVDLVKGDLRSTVFGQPIGTAIRDRAPVTLRSVGQGLAVGWCAALSLAAAAALAGRGLMLVPALALNGALLSIPSALLATLCILANLPPGFAIAAVILPRAFPHAYEQVRGALGSPSVVMARAQGLAPARLLFFHVAPAAVPPLLALAGVSISVAFGAAIPIEALGDSPGIGQMAWRAALGRDLPVLVTVTLLLTVITTCSNLAADLVLLRLHRAP